MKAVIIELVAVSGTLTECTNEPPISLGGRLREVASYESLDHMGQYFASLALRQDYLCCIANFCRALLLLDYSNQGHLTKFSTNLMKKNNWECLQ